MLDLPLVFVHGSDPDATPGHPSPGAGVDVGREVRYVELPGSGSAGGRDVDADAGAVLDAVGDRAHVVADSTAAQAVIRAAQLSPATVASLVLFEPSALHQADTDAAAEDVFADVPTLAVTGPTSDASASMADRIVELGGEKAELSATGGLVPQTPEAMVLISEFIERVESRASG